MDIENLIGYSYIFILFKDIYSVYFVYDVVLLIKKYILEMYFLLNSLIL